MLISYMLGDEKVVVGCNAYKLKVERTKLTEDKYSIMFLNYDSANPATIVDGIVSLKKANKILERIFTKLATDDFVDIEHIMNSINKNIDD